MLIFKSRIVIGIAEEISGQANRCSQREQRYPESATSKLLPRQQP
jgi:hypothetical protein